MFNLRQEFLVEYYHGQSKATKNQIIAKMAYDYRYLPGLGPQAPDTRACQKGPTRFYKSRDSKC
jgi:hypothetical protein